MASQVLGVFMLKLPCFASISNPNYHQTLKGSKVPFFFGFFLKNLISFLLAF